MPRLSALAISIGVFSFALVWLYLGPLAGLGLQTWAGFIAWGAYAHAGGGLQAAKKNLPGHLLGAILSWLVHLAAPALAAQWGMPLAAGLLVGIGSAAFVLAAHFPVFGAIPAAVYGFSCVAALVNVGDRFDGLLSPSTADNALLAISLSMLIGILFGLASDTGRPLRWRAKQPEIRPLSCRREWSATRRAFPCGRG